LRAEDLLYKKKGETTMQRYLIIVTLVIAGIVGIGFLPVPLFAQERMEFTDFRGRDYTADELSAALFPPREEVRTRGIAPRVSQQQAPTKVSVALNVFFAINSDKILPTYYSDLDKLGQVLTRPQYAEYRVQIEGHTDSTGTEGYNQRLSERRAESIKHYLVQKFGIEKERLATRGYGEAKPIASNETAEGRDKNRRVEVVNLGQ
jgi:outer membrane protein OmpA-like peptidoglycan-associated protein